MNSNAETRVDRDHLSAIEAENANLRATIVALREELEQSRIDREFAVQQAMAAGVDEIQQLRSSVASLRDALEERDVSYVNRIEAIERQNRDEARQLQETIRLLRDQLEEPGA